MKQVFLTRSGGVTLGDAPAPSCGPGEVLIDVAHSVISTGTETAAVASTDLRSRIETGLRLAQLGAERLRTAGLRETLRKARVREGIGAATGYSVAGVIREVGSEVLDLEVGAHVAAGGAQYAHHAEVVSVPRNLVVPVPSTVTLEAASFATVGAIALQGVRRAAPQVGETVVVIGLGLVGQLSAQILAASGCRVLGVDPRVERRALAEGHSGLVQGFWGSDAEIEAFVLAATGGGGADAVLLCAGTPSSDPANLALRVVRQRGRVVVVGALGMDLERAAFYRKEVEFTISCSYGPGRYDPSYEEGGLDYPIGFVRWTENRNLAAFVDLAGAGCLDPMGLIEGRHALVDAPAAFEAAKSAAGSGVAWLLDYPGLSEAPHRTVEMRAPTPAEHQGPLRLALLGAGGFATGTLMPIVEEEPDLMLRAVVTRTGSSAARVAEEFRAEFASTDADEILADPGVDAVLVATRHDSHAALATAALAAGKHVLLEKPMAIRREELDALRDAAARSGLVFSVGYNRRYSPFSQEVAALLARTAGPVVAEYRVNAGPVPDGHWTLDPAVGGGRIVGEACHMIDLLLFWLGPDVIEWGAVGVPSVQAHAASPEDFSVSLRLRDRGGREHIASLLYTASGSREVAKERIELHAGGGTIVLDDFENLEVRGLPGRSRRLRSRDKGHRAELQAFRAAIRGEANALLGVEEAWRAADLALRIDERVRAGRAG